MCRNGSDFLHILSFSFSPDFTILDSYMKTIISTLNWVSRLYMIHRRNILSSIWHLASWSRSLKLHESIGSGLHTIILSFMQCQVITFTRQTVFYVLEIPLQRDSQTVVWDTQPSTARLWAGHRIKMSWGGIHKTTLVWVVREGLFEEDTFKFDTHCEKELSLRRL